MARLVRCDRCGDEIAEQPEGDHHVLKAYTVPKGDAILKADICGGCLKVLTEEFLKI